MEGGDGETLHCDQCGKGFRAASSSKKGESNARGNLARHIASHKAKLHVSRKMHRFVCDACGCEMKQGNDLARHFGTQHGLSHLRPKQISTRGHCDWCQAEASKKNLWKHMRNCSLFPGAAAFRRLHKGRSYVETRYGCDDCDWSQLTHSTQGLFLHWSRRHSGRWRLPPHRFFCDTCPFKSRQRRCITIHLTKTRCF